jgi:hypothetical protein
LRLKLEDYLQEIEKEGYKINCQSRIRRYGGGDFGYNIPPAKTLNRFYNQELEDTLNVPVVWSFRLYLTKLPGIGYKNI